MENWLAEAHGDNKIPCHVLGGAQCAGSSIYRANVLKCPRDKSVLRLPVNEDDVFASPKQFKEHHERTAVEVPEV